MDYNLLEKKIRAKVIKEHMKALGIKKAVCFTCGNATKALRKEGIDTLSIGEHEELKPQKWFTPEEIAKQFPDHFNATSGDLPIFLMEKIAGRMRKALKTFKGGKIKVGSGETLLVLTLAFPERKQDIEPYRDGTPETSYDEGATLNGALSAIYDAKIWKKRHK